MNTELKPCQFRQVDTQGRILCQLVKGGDRQVSAELCRVCPVQTINCQHLRAGLEKQVSTPITVRFATGRVEVWNDAPAAMTFKQAACAAKTMPIHSARDCAGCPIRLPNVIPQNAIQVAHRSKANPAPSANSAQAAAQNVVVAQANPPTRVPRSVAPLAQPVAQAQAATVDVGAANDLIARAQATAARKAQEKQQRELERVAREQAESYNASPPVKPKIIQMKEWLAGQMRKNQDSAQRNALYKPQAIPADADGVSDIVYAPLGAQTFAAYQETVDYERCVGWTD
ncbi:MAG: hypothetical protein B6D41_07010 [Chloroflexi bacterium UTCFX4]|nr:MAG: hypothetical protein B6D41_07010 [Chloroflexi bacterium UTCFX4]